MATLTELANALFKSQQDGKNNFEIFMSSPYRTLIQVVGTALDIIVRESSSSGKASYSTEFLHQFREEELEQFFKPDTYGMLMFIQQLFEDKRFGEKDKRRFWYFTYLLPLVLKKGEQIELIKRWDTSVKDMIFEYKHYLPTSDHPNTEDYIKGPLKQLISNSESIESLETARTLILSAVEDISLSGLYTFTYALAIIQGKVKDPKKVEEWYQPLIGVIRKYHLIMTKRINLKILKDVIENSGSPKSLNNFKPYSETIITISEAGKLSKLFD